jgi:hypothetical protein
VDPLAAALAATRSNSQLPSAMLARAAAPGVQAGVPAAEWRGAHEAAQLAEASAPMQRGLSANGKRKERGFTVSGTGTGSESSGANDEEEEQRGSQRFKWAEEQRETLADLRTEMPPPDGPSLVTQSSVCRWLAAQCMVRQGKLYEALDTLSGGKDDAQEVEGESTCCLSCPALPLTPHCRAARHQGTRSRRRHQALVVQVVPARADTSASRRQRGRDTSLHARPGTRRQELRRLLRAR